MSYACTIRADSVSPSGSRLTTYEITFPRFILAELNTHRMLSRNSASSRAIPTERMIENVRADPFVPEFCERVTGMGVGKPLTGLKRQAAEAAWLRTLRHAIEAAERLLDVDKSRANRLLEPFMWHTAIVSATDWQNFFAQRTSPQAQPEFQLIAYMMQEQRSFNSPRFLEPGEWHLPLVEESERDYDDGIKREAPAAAFVSARRCARVSYNRQHDDEPLMLSVDRCEGLAAAQHWSPLEHPAQAGSADLGYRGNFFGFTQLRKFFPEESGQDHIPHGCMSPDVF
jgi:thymidylate synthase ThyX